MSEFLATSPALPGEAATVEGRLADIIEMDDAVVQISEYKLSQSDRARLIAALRLAAAATPASDRRAHKTMTADEYAEMPIVGWHEVCRDVDGFGGTGVRFLGETALAAPQALESATSASEPAIPAVWVTALIGNVREYERYGSIDAAAANAICKYLNRTLVSRPLHSPTENKG